MAERFFDITKEKPVLHMPVVHKLNKWYVKITDAQTDKQFTEYYIGLTEGEPKFYYPLYLYELIGKQVKLSCEDENVPGNIFDGIIQGGKIEEHPELYPDIYKEKDRQQLHFSSRRGWLNDPNGLFYKDGVFHLYYQHNPFSPFHNDVNVSWGHATTKDCIHFKEYPDAVRPYDTETSIASGTAIVDEYNISGKGKDTVIGAYTALSANQYNGRKPLGITKGQYLVYSLDGGYSFKHFFDKPFITVPKGEHWRDPKLLFADDGNLCAAVYERFEDRDCISFYSSKDCVNWKLESRAMDLFECPDLFRMTVCETGEKMWVLYAGDGFFRVGSFENYTFTPVVENLSVDYGDSAYAGQTWNSYPDEDVRFHISWTVDYGKDGKSNIFLETDKPHPNPFNQSMSLMCKLTLHKINGEYKLFRTPAGKIETLRTGEPEVIENIRNSTEKILPVPSEVLLEIKANEPLELKVNGHGLSYDPKERLLKFTNRKQHNKEYKLQEGKGLKIRMIEDVKTTEMFICDEISATFSDYDDGGKKLTIECKDSITDMKIHKLNSIWETE
ncbi:MAG: glycoside hydrolase family 32 protein [Clostridia bacterium]|nr:glycoside hydrolase family 32 protein [Clostridia bacterium]